MVQRATSIEHPPRDYRAMIIIAVVVVFVVNGGLVGWGYWLSVHAGRVQLSGLKVIGLTALCPGELLVYDYLMHVTRPATINLNTTIERVEPALKDINPVTFTSSQQFSVYSETTMKLRRNVYFGETYTDPATGKDSQWLPGEYQQRTTASVIGRSEFSEIVVSFSVRQDCQRRSGN